MRRNVTVFVLNQEVSFTSHMCDLPSSWLQEKLETLQLLTGKEIKELRFFFHVFGNKMHIKLCKNGHCNVHILQLTKSPPTQKHGLVIIPDGTPNGDVNHEPQPSGITVVSQEAAQLLESAGEGPLGETATTRQCPFTRN